MFCARRELCLRARAAQCSEPVPSTAPSSARSFGKLTSKKVAPYSPFLSIPIRSPRLYSAKTRLVLLHLKRSHAPRLYSTGVGEAIRNRFNGAHETDEVEPAENVSKTSDSVQLHESKPVETAKKAFIRLADLPYVPARLKRDKKALNCARLRRREKWHQWGYLRHQYPASEMNDMRKEFNQWKSILGRLLVNRNAKAHEENEHGKWLYNLADVDSMRKAWEDVSVEQRQKKWSAAMLATLRWCPSKASMVLEATMDPLPPGYAIHDVLVYILQNLRLDSVKNAISRAAMADELLLLLARIIEGTPKAYVPFRQSTFGSFARKLPVDQVRHLYDILDKHNYKLHKNTLLQFAGKLAGDPAHKNAAYEILKTMLGNGATLDNISSNSIITTLLHCKAADDGWGSAQPEVFNAKDAMVLFMEHGYVPNAITLTAMVDSLCQHGQVEEAIRLTLLFAESGVQLDAKTWTTVFAGAKDSLNVENITKAFLVAKVTPASYESILANALHAVFYFADSETRIQKLKLPWSVPMFRPMLKIYAKRFRLNSLQWWLPDSLPLMLGDEGLDPAADGKFRSPSDRSWDFMRTILPVVDKVFSTGAANTERLQPNTTSDAIMLRAYIRSLSDPQDILSFYQFFKWRLQEDSKYPRLLLQNQGAMIHDTFILVMTEHRQLWREALHVFGDMLKDSLLAKSAQKQDPTSLDEVEEAADTTKNTHSVEAAPRSRVHPPPTVFTMTILLRGLLYQGEEALANQMMQVMREVDIEPNLVTWNTLIKHHALSQNTRATVELLQGMEAAGLKPNGKTYSAFSKLGSLNQEKALRMMQSIVDANRERMEAGQLLRY